MVNNQLSKLINDASKDRRPSTGRLYGLSMFFRIQSQRLHFYSSKFIVTGDVKSETIDHSYEETRNVFQ